MPVAVKDLRDALPRTRRLIEVHPHDGAHRAALRAGASVAIPLLALWLGGRLAWAPAATFGALTSIYGRAEPHAGRLRMQFQAGAALTIAVTIGTAVGCCPGRRWLSVLAVTACAAAGSLAADRLGWHPPGPLFIVFSSATLASHAATPALVPVACAVTAATALLAALVGTAGWLRPAARRAADRPPAGGPPAAVPAADQPPPASHGWQWIQAARYSIAILLAGAVATAIGTGHPYWSMVAAVAAVTGPDTAARLTRAIQRIAGTVLGVLVAAGILAPHLPVLAAIGVITVLQCATELVVGRNYALAVIFLTPLALVMGTLSQPAGEWALLHDRTIETLLGAAIGVAINLAAHRGAAR